MVKLILIRHGQSLWNAENRFTGWVDSSLSRKGQTEAKKAGKYLNALDIKIEVCFTSLLKRAINTLNIILSEINTKNCKIFKAWQLNERHYGSLTGLNKLYVKEKIGESMFLKYRRSWDIAPPKIGDKDPNLKKYSTLNYLIPKKNIPSTESLKDTYIRVINYYENNIAKLISNNKTVIVAAHGNSLRALCKFLFNITDKKINNLEIPTGNPMIIEMLDHSKIQDAYYLDKDRALPILGLKNKV